VKKLRYWLGTLLALLFFLSCNPPLPHDRAWVYLINNNPDEVVVVDPTSGTVRDRFLAGDLLSNIAVLPDGKTAFITSLVSARIAVVDLDRARVMKNLSVPGFPSRVVPHPYKPRIYLIIGREKDITTNEVSIMDVNTREIVKRVGVKYLLTELHLTPNGKWLYAFSAMGTTIFCIDTEKEELVPERQIELANSPSAITITPDSRYLLFTYNSTDILEIVEADTQKRVASLSVGDNPSFVATSRDGKYAYVSDLRGRDVYIVDLSTYTLSGKIRFDLTPALIRAGMKYLYVTGGSQEGWLFIADPVSRQQIRKVPLQSVPVDMILRFPEKG